MDDLDRLYHELVDSMRRQRPAALLKPLTVHEIHERLVPYRRLRNFLGFRSNEDYEAALSRLLSGERGYLASDGAMQSELRAALDEQLPDIRRYRSYPDARVWLSPEQIPPPGDIRYAPPEVRERAVTDADPPAPVSGAESPIAEFEPDLTARQDASPSDAGNGESEAEEGGAPATTGRCPHCAGEPPESAAFCPFCGTRLSVELCGACGAEIEPAWQYCAACGKPKD